MERYELAKLVQWSGKLRTRKRMQKVVYLLQAAGCPLQADYRLHHFGPYSPDVAETTDVMVQVGLLEEECEPYQGGQQFNYVLKPEAVERVAKFEKTPQGLKALKRLDAFRKRALDLLNADVRDLEMAATIAYFRKKGRDWKSAVESTCKFKRIASTDTLMQRAEALARQHVK